MLDRCTLLPDSIRNMDKPVIQIPVKEQPVVQVIYVFVANNESYKNMANRFLDSYTNNLPGYPHQTIIACNNGTASGALRERFLTLPNCELFEHDNSGYDIGAYQHVSRFSKADLLLCLTSSTFFNGANWLKRCVEVYRHYGDCLYGTMGNKGDAHVGVNRHIRSTAFWLSPSLFNQYPYHIETVRSRYDFEHKQNCLTEWCLRNGIQAWVVTWAGVFQWANWDDDPEGFQRGSQKHLMIGDHICQPPHYPRK